MSWHDRLFKALMRVLPAEFRGEYEREMAATFRAERRGADGAASLMRVWLATVADVFRTAPAEHLDILRRDLAYTVRRLARRPVLTLTAVLTLALGIGANTAIFSVVNGVLFAPFDYRGADQLVLIEEQPAGRDPGTTGYATFADLRNENLTLESTAAHTGGLATLTGDGRDAERVVGARVTWEYFRTVGLTPAIGRDFEQGEDRPGGPQVAIISDSLWRRRYGADPDVVGRPITVNQQTVTVAGGRAAAGYQRHHCRAHVTGHRDLDAARVCGTCPAGLPRVPPHFRDRASQGRRHTSRSGGRPHAHLSIAGDAFSDRLRSAAPRGHAAPRLFSRGPGRTASSASASSKRR